MELVTKLILAIPAIIGAGKIIYDITIGKKSHLREEYKFAKEFLSDVENGGLHPFALEKGYYSLAGTTCLSPEVIAYILSLKKPSQCLKDYVLSYQLMEELQPEGNLKLNFKKKYKASWYRNCLKFFYSAGYFLFAFIAVSPLIVSQYLGISVPNSFVLLAFTLPLSGTLAWTSLTAFVKIARGEELVLNQEKHTSTIIVMT